MTTRELRLNRKSVSLLYLLCLIINLFTIACAGSEQSAKSEQRVASSTPSQTSVTSPTATETAQQTTPAESLELPPPQAEEVREVVARVYKDAVAIEPGRRPAAIVGDFNGDGSQDIAVVVRPAKDKLEEINGEFANWILEDPRKVALPDPRKSVQQHPPDPGPVKVQPGDLLLTIIHGYKKEGWRNPEARQAYLLDNAVGSLMSAEAIKDLQNSPGNMSGLPKSGDVIKETLAGERGLIYWTGAKYAWKSSRQLAVIKG